MRGAKRSSTERWLAVFVAAIILWTIVSLPNYLVSLIVIITPILTGVLPEREAYAQLGQPIMWLNIVSCILASMLVKTGLATRFTLWFLVRFGKRASSVFLSFIVINVTLSAFISATTANAAILLPVFLVPLPRHHARRRVLLTGRTATGCVQAFAGQSRHGWRTRFALK